ncbi:MAG TPA: DUF2141 domain-containing protein, partial [Leptospiraceae bacterium]|nr:DUF2141 domain-containing protein [Leptospiraceae bacterium]
IYSFALAGEDLCSLKVEIIKFRNNDGQALINLFNKSDGFPSKRDKAFQSQKLPIHSNMATFHFKDIPCGEYAIGIMHDENNNLKMDTNLIGIPKEGYGVSNNVKSKLGPPKYEDAKITLQSANTIIQIEMNYF